MRSPECFSTAGLLVSCASCGKPHVKAGRLRTWTSTSRGGKCALTVTS